MATINPLYTELPQILFMAVMRISDRRIVATSSAQGDLDKDGLRKLIGGNESLVTGKRCSATGAAQTANYLLDATGGVYIVVTNKAYPPRVAFQVIDEFQEHFSKDYGAEIAAAKEEGLTRKSKKLLVQLYEKYCNPGNVDKLSNIQAKLEVTTSVMKENIEKMLENTARTEEINEKSQGLLEQSAIFEKQAKKLKGTSITHTT